MHYCNLCNLDLNVSYWPRNFATFSFDDWELDNAVMFQIYNLNKVLSLAKDDDSDIIILDQNDVNFDPDIDMDIVDDIVNQHFRNLDVTPTLAEYESYRQYVITTTESADDFEFYSEDIDVYSSNDLSDDIVILNEESNKVPVGALMCCDQDFNNCTCSPDSAIYEFIGDGSFGTLYDKLQSFGVSPNNELTDYAYKLDIHHDLCNTCTFHGTHMCMPFRKWMRFKAYDIYEGLASAPFGFQEANVVPCSEYKPKPTAMQIDVDYIKETFLSQKNNDQEYDEYTTLEEFLQ